MIDLTQDYLRSLLSYDAETGELIWRHRPRDMFRDNDKRICGTWNARYAGTVANSIGTGGYVRVNILGTRYLGHRVIWMMVHGEWPDEIDHINGNRSDNRLCNIRNVSRQENLRNLAKRSDNSSGHVGVHLNKKNGKWSAYVGIDGKQVHLGFFENLDDAIAVRAKASKAYGFTERHGV